VGNPSGFFVVSFLGTVTTSRLSSCLNSGVITFTGSSFPLPAALRGDGNVAVVFVVLLLSPPLETSCDDDDGEENPIRNLGAGKFSFLSMASTRRWKRLNRASARMRVDSRSMVPESSLTARRLAGSESYGMESCILYFSTSSKCFR